MRQRGTIFIVLFMLIAAAIIAASRFLGSQPALEFTIAVDPLAQTWLQEAVKAFNNTQPVVNTRRIVFTVTPVDDLDVWQGQRRWTTDSHPDAWLAASGLSLQYAQQSIGLPMKGVITSLARTPLVWGGYASRVDLLTSNGGRTLDWDLLAGTLKNNERWVDIGGQADWQFVKLGFGQPGNKIGGLAALLTAAANFNQTPDLSQAILSQQLFRTWLSPVVAAKPSFANTGITGDPAAAMAGGPSRIEIALFPEAQWLLNLRGMNNQEEVRLSYPAYQMLLDFPLAAWNDTTPANTDRQTAVGLLSAWLQTAEQQAKVMEYGLRPASSEPTTDNTLFKAGIPSGILLNPDYGQIITAPPVNETSGLIEWVENNG